MDPGIDFNYFSPAPMPYTFFGPPPTPQGQIPRADDYRSFQQQDGNEHFDTAFAAFQQNYHYHPAQLMGQPSLHHNGPVSPPIHNTNRHSIASLPEDLSQEFDISPTEQQGLARSSSEEKDNLTPQQNKRKAQNRAAQRAFRERKEKHVKDLEARNTNLRHEFVSLQHETERLRRELARATAENEILRATSGSSSIGPTPFLPEADRDDLDSIVPGPLGYTPTDYSSKLKATKDGTTTWSPNAKWAQFGTLTTVAVDEDNGEPMYTAGQTWDYIQGHDLYKKGLVDVGDVCERLKKLARCDGVAGQGPLFLEGDIRKVIDESAVAGGRDELI